MIIRELKPDDMLRICQLLRTREELDEERVQKRKILMEWCAFKNPFAGNEPTYFIAEDQGNIVAYIGRMPMMFIVKGELQKGYYSHELYVHPEYRRKGLGFFLSMSLYKTIEEKSQSFIVGPWGNNINLELQRRRGYSFLNFDLYIRVLKPYPILKKYIKIESFIKIINPVMNAASFALDFLMINFIGVKQGKDKFFIMKRLDPDYDNFVQELVPKLGICPLKDSYYLNWKYFDKPFSQVDVLGINKSGKIKGVVALSLTLKYGYPVGTIVDIIADPEDTETISSLCMESINYFRRKNAHYIRCFLSDRRFSKIFNKFLFFRRSGSISLALANLEKAQNKNILLNIHNWHICSGDSDGFMF